MKDLSGRMKVFFILHFYAYLVGKTNNTLMFKGHYKFGSSGY